VGCTTTLTSGNSSIDTSLIRDIYCGPEVLFETCVAMKFVDNDDDDYIQRVCQNAHKFIRQLAHCTGSQKQTRDTFVCREAVPWLCLVMLCV